MRSAPAHLVLIGGLAACTAGPDYQLPKNAIATAPAATKLFAGGAVPGFSADPLPPHWWRLYDDARLDEYIVEGLAANRGLRAADANLRAASFVVREAEAAELPTTTLSASGGLSRALASTVPLASAAGYELGGGLTYPLDLAGGIRRGIEAAKDDDEAAEAARDQVRVAVVAAISRSYLAACSANRTLDVAERVVGLQQQTLEVTERLFNGGRGTAFDVTRAQAAVGQSASAIPPIIAAKDASLFELGALLGRAPADYPKEVADCAAPPALKRPLPIGDGAALIRRRPDLREAERELAAATATIGIETAQLYPQVSLGGSADFGGPSAAFAGHARFALSLGPLVTWTFPNLAVAHARIGAAGATAEAAAAQFDSAVIGALQQTETALSAYARELDHNRDLYGVRDDDARAAAEAERLFRLGRTDFINVLTAEANLAGAEAALTSSDASVSDRQIDVFLALGGGWE